MLEQRRSSIDKKEQTHQEEFKNIISAYVPSSIYKSYFNDHTKHFNGWKISKGKHLVCVKLFFQLLTVGAVFEAFLTLLKMRCKLTWNKFCIHCGHIGGINIMPEDSEILHKCKHVYMVTNNGRWVILIEKRIYAGQHKFMQHSLFFFSFFRLCKACRVDKSGLNGTDRLNIGRLTLPEMFFKLIEFG